MTVDQKLNGYIVSTQVARTLRPAHSSVHDAELEILGFLARHAGNCTAAHTNGNCHRTKQRDILYIFFILVSVLKEVLIKRNC